MVLVYLLIILLVINILTTYNLYLVVKGLPNHEDKQTIAEDEDIDQVADQTWNEQFDERIERMKHELAMSNQHGRVNDIVAQEMHPNVKNIPHDEVQHLIQRSLRDEVAD